jgi:uncharacterized protein
LPTVRVRGEASARAEPDEALLWITLSFLDESPGRALAEVAARSDALLALLDELAVPTADRSTTGLTVSEDFDHTPSGRHSLGHRAVAGVQVRFDSAEPIGRLVSRASEDLQAGIHGPRWLISSTNPIRLEAAKQAAVNAKEKAEAYAAGVGAQVGALIMLSEPDTGYGVHELHRTAAAFSAAGGDMPIASGEHEVLATIEATFALEPR